MRLRVDAGPVLSMVVGSLGDFQGVYVGAGVQDGRMLGLLGRQCVSVQVVPWSCGLVIIGGRVGTFLFSVLAYYYGVG